MKSFCRCSERLCTGRFCVPSAYGWHEPRRTRGLVSPALLCPGVPSGPKPALSGAVPSTDAWVWASAGGAARGCGARSPLLCSAQLATRARACAVLPCLPSSGPLCTYTAHAGALTARWGDPTTVRLAAPLFQHPEGMHLKSEAGPRIKPEDEHAYCLGNVPSHTMISRSTEINMYFCGSQ